MAAAIIYFVIDAKRSLTPATLPTPAQPEQTQSNQTQTEATTNEKTPNMEGGVIEKTLSKVMVNVLQTPEGKEFMSKLITPANKPITGEYTLKVNDLILTKELFHIDVTSAGVGPKVSCGHTVKVDYTITNSKNIIVDSGQKTFRLGDSEVILGLSNVIVGMQKGETRKAMLHKNYSYNSPYYSGNKPEQATDYYYVNVTLLDAAPENFADDKVKIFDDEIGFAVPYLCGMPATFNAKIMKIDGTVIYDAKETNMYLGDDKYPMIFSHALFNKVPVGTRTVICRGGNLKSFDMDGVNKVFPKAQERPTAKDFFLIEFSGFKQDSK